MNCVTITSDLGLQDFYLAALKGNLLRLLPDSQLIDVSHTAAPQDVRTIAFLIQRTFHHFPEGTIHLAVCGDAPKLLVIAHANHWFILPDNGLASLITGLKNPEAWKVEVVGKDASNFTGLYETYATTAAKLQKGIALAAFARPAQEIEQLNWPEPQVNGLRLTGHILYFDRFGNALTNLPHSWVLVHSDLGKLQFQVRSLLVQTLSRHWQSVNEGEPLAYLGDSGYLELAIRAGSAREAFGLQLMDSVLITAIPPTQS
jgi:S-adenosyl-L-methionine hydrolase (adenosine-forming)